MSRNSYNIYSASGYGRKEVELNRLFHLQVDDARNYFLSVIKPRLDRSYKLYIAYGGDRQREIKRWQANVQIPYIQAAVETLVPRIIDARPEFSVIGRNQDDQAKAEKQQQLSAFFWEKAGMDATTEDLVRSTLIFGSGYLQVSWKKDVRALKYLNTRDIASKKYKWDKKEKTFFDGPFAEWVDNYNLWYDWHNSARKSKQYWFKRWVLPESEIIRRYPMADKERLTLALNSPGGDLSDYAAIRQQVRTTHLYTTKSSAAGMYSAGGSVFGSDKYYSTQDNTLKMYEVFEWWRPFDDSYSVVVGGSNVPIFKGGEMPIPFDFKEAPFVEVTYLKIPGEFEGYGLPLILESPQVMLNLIKNQRLDAATLSIHKMWIVNPLANVNKDELVTRPFGIIYSIDPNGVKEIQFSDIKMSAYKEEELLKSDMQYASGVDDFSMGVGQRAGSATEVRHLRESTLERVRLFVNHLGDAYSDVLRYWMDMTRQLFTKEMTIRVIGKEGAEMFPLIEKDDLQGMFDYRATVLPSIAGQDDVKKKQDMDLFQLLINLPFVDPQKLTSRVVADWGWSLDGLIRSPEETQQAIGAAQGIPGLEALGGQPPQGFAPPPVSPPEAGVSQEGAPLAAGGPGFPEGFRRNVDYAVNLLRKRGEQSPNISSFSQFSRPVNLLRSRAIPPTTRGISANIPNIAGFNRGQGSRVNTDIPLRQTSSPYSKILNKAVSIQKRQK